MNYKSFVLKIISFFSAVCCFSLHAKSAMKPMAAQVTQIGAISIACSFIIVSFLFYVVMNLVQDRWGALQASLILLGSFLLGSYLMLFFIHSSPNYLFILMNFSFVVFPLLLQVGSWFLLFKKHGWVTILLLCGISLLFPILMLTIGSSLTSFFGLSFNSFNT